MHGLTGGSWKRSVDWATDAEKNNPGGKPRGIHGSTTYRRSTPPRQLPTLQQRVAARVGGTRRGRADGRQERRTSVGGTSSRGCLTPRSWVCPILSPTPPYSRSP